MTLVGTKTENGPSGLPPVASPGLAPHPWSDLPVKFLVLHTDGFTVFLDDELDVDWRTSDAHDESHVPSERAATLNRVAFLQAVPIAHLPYDQRLGFRRMLGEAVARALENDANAAETMLAKAEEFVTLRNSEHARVWYLSSVAVATGSIAALALGTWLAKGILLPIMGQRPLELLLAAAAGSLGATLSTSSRVSRLSLDASAGRGLHMFEGASRVVIGAICGVVAWLAARSGLVAPQLIAKPGSIELWLLLCLVAGASERLVPSIVERFELAAASEHARDAKTKRGTRHDRSD